MAVMLIARFDGDVDELRPAYDRAHALIMSRGGATGAGELLHHCAIGEGALYIIGVWQSDNGACRTEVVLDATAVLELARCSAPYVSRRRSTCSGWSPIWLMNWFVSK